MGRTAARAATHLLIAAFLAAVGLAEASAHAVVAAAYVDGVTIEGEVGFSNGDMVAGATIDVFTPGGERILSTTTDENGNDVLYVNSSDWRIAVGNDSGLMHLAACVGTPTVGIFGPTDEGRNGPMGERTLVVRRHLEGFPLWTAANVGSRAVPEGVNPRESLERLGVNEAWQKIEPWLGRIHLR